MNLSIRWLLVVFLLGAMDHWSIQAGKQEVIVSVYTTDDRKD